VAGARKVELDCGGSFSQAAALAVEVRGGEVFGHSDRVLDLTDVEGVHDMRVATRRLRAALEVFAPCFPAKRHRKLLKKVKALADALGKRRDADVEIALLEDLAGETSEADRAALEGLIDRRRGRQREANEELRQHVAPKPLKQLRRGLERLVESGRVNGRGTGRARNAP
jgi:CHAD domain-containing protein